MKKCLTLSSPEHDNDVILITLTAANLVASVHGCHTRRLAVVSAYDFILMTLDTR